MLMRVEKYSDFENALRLRYSDISRRRAFEILEALRISSPRALEFLSGKESLFIFLHEHGLALRFGLRARTPVSDSILQPFVKYHLDMLSDFEILPGVRVGGSALDKLSLFIKLYRAQILFPRQEMVKSNIGALFPMNGEKHRIVIDRGACCTLSGHFNEQAHSEPGQLPVQRRYYRHFLTEAASTFGDSLRNIQTEALEAFLHACKNNTARHDNDPYKRLYNEWCPLEQDRKKSNQARAVALRYAERVAL